MAKLKVLDLFSGIGGFRWSEPSNCGETLAYPDSERCAEAWGGTCWCRLARGGRAVADQWATEPGLGRVAHGVPNRVDRLEELGNAVVPQIPEIIGRAILKRLAA